jgi:hypothetical protein
MDIYIEIISLSNRDTATGSKKLLLMEFASQQTLPILNSII